MSNNPIRYTDPTGHYACGDGEKHDCHGHRQDPNQNPYHLKPHKDDDLDGYSGPLHSDVQDILVSHGANRDLLDAVTIYLKTEEALSACQSNQLAYTANNNIYICTLVDNNGDVVYDPHTPTPVLLHELVHVRQFRDNRIGTWIELAVINVKKTINKDYNPYKESWVEIEGSLCQDTYNANPNIPLDSGVCNLK